MKRLHSGERFQCLRFAVTWAAPCCWRLRPSRRPHRIRSTTLHVDVKLVSIFVNVTDKNGALVGGLTQNDFAVYEDGRPQQIAVFEHQSELPLNLTLAIDTRGSVHKDLSEEATRRGVSPTPFCVRRTR